MHEYWQADACPRAAQKAATYRSFRSHNWQCWCYRLAQSKKYEPALWMPLAPANRPRARLWLRAYQRDFYKFLQRRIPMNNENLTLHFKVKDFNAWQTSYNGNEKNRTSAGITKSKVFRSIDDPNDVLILQDVADVSKARTWYSSSEMKSVMEKSGVVGSPSIRAAA
jgi:transposase